MSKIGDRQIKDKNLVIEQLKKTPIVQLACEKTGVSRATFIAGQRGSDFSQKTEEAISQGNLLVNDMAESQLMSAIRDKNLTAIIFWLKHHHSTYATRVEVLAKIKRDDEQLTPEQEELITRALKLAEIIPETMTITNQDKPL
jgi:hypothetical protein